MRTAQLMKAPIIRTKFAPARGDLEVSYRPWGAAKFGGLPVVPVHGDWTTSASWTRLAGELTERWLLAPDLRGRGKTRGPDHGYSVGELATDLVTFLDAVELERVHLLGHGLGAAVCAQLALREPKRVATLTMVAPPQVDGTPAEAVDETLPETYKASSRTFAQALGELAPKAPRDMLWAGLIEDGYKQRLSAATANIAALRAWAPGEELRTLSMPRRVVVGELDPQAGPTAERAARASDCERTTIPGVGHYPQLEAPEALAEVVRAVIAEIEGIRG